MIDIYKTLIGALELAQNCNIGEDDIVFVRKIVNEFLDEINKEIELEKEEGIKMISAPFTMKLEDEKKLKDLDDAVVRFRKKSTDLTGDYEEIKNDE